MNNKTPPILYPILYDFQKKIVDQYHNRQRLGLFLDMGLGKTLISLALCEKNEVNKIIIISIKPKAIENKQDIGSFDYYLHNLNFKVYKKSLSNKAPDLQDITNYEKTALILNYEALTSKNSDFIYDFITNNNHNKHVPLFNQIIKNKIAVILDESHKVKNPSTSISKAVKKLNEFITKYQNQQAENNKTPPPFYLYLLTGTPFSIGYIDLYNQLVLLGHKQTKTDFINYYCIRGNIKGLYEYQQPIIGYRNIEHLFSIVKKYAITEKTLNNIKLPEQVFYDILTPSNNFFKLLTNQYFKANKIYDYLNNQPPTTNHQTNQKQPATNQLKALQNINHQIKPSNKKKILNPLYRNLNYPLNDDFIALTPASLWMRARQINIGFLGNAESYKIYDYTRFNELRNFLLNNKNNYVIFYNYTPEFFILFDLLSQLDFKIDVYNGEIKDLHFYNKYANLSETEKYNDTNKRVIITNYQSGGTGLNLQHYNHVILFSLPLYGVYSQALKRNHRIGQNKTVFYYTFYAKNWLDLSMLKALKNGEKYNEDLFNNELKENQEK